MAFTISMCFSGLVHMSFCLLPTALKYASVYEFVGLNVSTRNLS